MLRTTGRTVLLLFTAASGCTSAARPAGSRPQATLADSNVVVSRSMIQYEHFLPTNHMRYGYPVERSVSLGDLSFA